MAHRAVSQLEQDKRDLRREEERKLSRMEEQRRRSDELWRVKEKKTMQRAFEIEQTCKKLKGDVKAAEADAPTTPPPYTFSAGNWSSLR